MKHAYVPRTTNYTLNPGDDLNDLRMSDQVRPLYDHVKQFIRETVEPMSVEFKAEKALDMMVQRGLTREAFGKKVAHLGGNLQIIAQARCEIEAMRLMVLKAAKAMDVLGNKEARVWVSMVKAMIPERVC